MRLLIKKIVQYNVVDRRSAEKQVVDRTSSPNKSLLTGTPESIATGGRSSHTLLNETESEQQRDKSPLAEKRGVSSYERRYGDTGYVVQEKIHEVNRASPERMVDNTERQITLQTNTNVTRPINTFLKCFFIVILARLQK